MTLDRLLARTRPGPGGCQLWTGSRNRGGYGQAHHDGRRWAAHRLAYTLANGPIPLGLWVLHDCDTPACVRPAHLHLGDHRQNMAEARARRRWPGPRPLCGRGHPKFGLHADVYVHPYGALACRACRRATDHARRHSEAA